MSLAVGYTSRSKHIFEGATGDVSFSTGFGFVPGKSYVIDIIFDVLGLTCFYSSYRSARVSGAISIRSASFISGQGSLNGMEHILSRESRDWYETKTSSNSS